VLLVPFGRTHRQKFARLPRALTVFSQGAKIPF
jgi:hypothetical protein